MKKTSLMLFLLLVGHACFADVQNVVVDNSTNLVVVIGAALAVTICWGRTGSILVSALAGLFGWFYVIYYAIFLRPNEEED